MTNNNINMEIFHYTNKNNINSIQDKGLIPYEKCKDTNRINNYLEKICNNQEIIHIRKKATYFYNIEQYTEDEEINEPILELIINISDLELTKLFVANWKYAELVYIYAKGNTENKKELEMYAKAYIESIKPVSNINDIFLYNSVELLYIGDIQPNNIKFNLLEE